MEQIIRKAVEGEYELPGEYPILFQDSSKRGYSDYLSVDFAVSAEETPLHSIVCDPLFWQALGKAFGWFYEDGRSVAKYINNDPKHTQKDMWLWHAEKFHELNLTESWDAAVSWLSNLIENK